MTRLAPAVGSGRTPYRDVSEMDSTLLAGRYRLVARIGAGGTAEVWRAHDGRLDRDVAIKLLHGHLLPDEHARARVLAEARAVASLRHPGIVTIHDVVEGDDRIGLVLELVEGESLAERIGRGPVPPGVAASIGAGIADALEEAHQRGLVHRDVKPANVLVTRTGSARLVDFGIAHALKPDADRLTAPGTVMGSLRWMAPEQLAGRPATPATDVWGLGMVVYAMLAGREPFNAVSPAALIAEQQTGPPPIPGIDGGLDAIVRRALAPSPEGRTASAAEAGDALRAWLHGASVAVADEDPTVPLATRWGPLPPAPSGGRTGRILPGAAVALVLLLLAGLIGTALVGTGWMGPGAVAEDRATPIPSRTVAPTAAPTPRATAAPVVNAGADGSTDDKKGKPGRGKKPKKND